MDQRAVSLRQRQARRAARARPARSAAWLTTGILLTTGFAWWVLHYYAAMTQVCADYVAFWLSGEGRGMALLQWTSLLSLVTAIWFLGVWARPKRIRVPVTLRLLQALIPAFMLLISTLHWGLVQPNGPIAPAARAVAHALGEYPVLSLFFRTQTVTFDYADGGDPLWAQYGREQAALAARYPPYPNAGFLAYSPFQTDRSGVMYCEASARLEALWEERFALLERGGAGE